MSVKTIILVGSNIFRAKTVTFVNFGEKVEYIQSGNKIFIVKQGEPARKVA